MSAEAFSVVVSVGTYELVQPAVAGQLGNQFLRSVERWVLSYFSRRKLLQGSRAERAFALNSRDNANHIIRKSRILSSTLLGCGSLS